MTPLLALVDWPVVTDRLVLRPATDDDVDAIFEIRRLPEVSEWITAQVSDRSELVERLEHRRAVVIELDGRIIGDLMIKIEDAWSQREVEADAAGVQAELGWILDPAHGGQGYATEAVTAAIDLCFGPLGLRRVIAHCFADNDASWRLMERVGMRRETHTVRESLHRTHGWLDGYSYGLLADEWPVSR